jgi:hypothetical protein
MLVLELESGSAGLDLEGMLFIFFNALQFHPAVILYVLLCQIHYLLFQISNAQHDLEGIL